LESIRAEKAEKFKELMHKRNSAEWNAWFFKYSPGAAVGAAVGKKRGKSVTRKSLVELDSSVNSRKKTQKKYKSIEKQENQENLQPKSKSRNILQKILGIGGV
jgi:hypothetical protein